MAVHAYLSGTGGPCGPSNQSFEQRYWKIDDIYSVGYGCRPMDLDRSSVGNRRLLCGPPDRHTIQRASPCSSHYSCWPFMVSTSIRYYLVPGIERTGKLWLKMLNLKILHNFYSQVRDERSLVNGDTARSGRLCGQVIMEQYTYLSTTLHDLSNARMSVNLASGSLNRLSCQEMEPANHGIIKGTQSPKQPQQKDQFCSYNTCPKETVEKGPQRDRFRWL